MPRATAQELIERGFLQQPRRGRPRIYATPEESLEVKKAQQRECVKRHAARIKEARELMKASEFEKIAAVVKVMSAADGTVCSTRKAAAALQNQWLCVGCRREYDANRRRKKSESQAAASPDADLCIMYSPLWQNWVKIGKAKEHSIS